MFSTNLPNTSLPVAITDAVGVLFHEQAADEVGCDGFGGAGEERLCEFLRELGGYGIGLGDGAYEC